MYSGNRSQAGARDCVVQCLHWGKAFGPGVGLEKHQLGTTACPKTLAMERCRGWLFPKANLHSHKWVWTYGTRVWVEGRLCSPAAYSPASWLWLPVTGELSLGARKMPCYSFVKVFSSRAEAGRGWKKSEPPWRSIPEVQREHWYLHLHVRKWGKSQDTNVINRQWASLWPSWDQTPISWAPCNALLSHPSKCLFPLYILINSLSWSNN